VSCAAHGERAVYDAKMRAWRCCSCGHRFSRAGEPVKATRRMAPWKWPRELYGRRWARQAGQGRHTRVLDGESSQGG
jgi:hypothetical protein